MNRHWIWPAAILVSLSVTANASAWDFSEERRLFLEAEQALQQGAWQRFRTLRAHLQNYPLAPYLDDQALRRRLARASLDEVEVFLQAQAGTPLARRLYRTWLRTLARQGRWQTLLAAYRPDTDTELECLYRRALYRTGRRQAALRDMERLWLVGRSQPRACDPLFAAWREAGGITTELAWRRFALAMENNRVRLARYLRRFLPPDERRWADLWLRVHRHPARHLSSSRLQHPHPFRNAILVHGLKRLAMRDPRRALRLWEETLRPRYDLGAAERARVERQLAIALAVHGDPEALARLAAVDGGRDDRALQEWRIRAALDQRNWYAVLAWIHQLEPSHRNVARWRYWQARALEALQQEEEAEALYLSLAGRRSYYGLLAADRLGLPYRLTPRHSLRAEAQNEIQTEIQTGIIIDAGSIATAREQKIGKETKENDRHELDPRHYPGLLRARELFLLDRVVAARREWYYATRDMAEWQLQGAARLAAAWGWHDRAITTMARTRYRDDLDLRFPLVHRTLVESTARAAGVDAALAFAVIRQESAFTPDARSPAGALGLMQLLPHTARQVARRLGVRLSHRRELLDVATNLRLGITHLAELLRRYQGHRVLALAAYNAGARRVQRWWPKERIVAADLWLETLPIAETRNYVGNVLLFTAIYEQRLGRQPSPLQQHMRPIAPPGLVLARYSEQRLDPQSDEEPNREQGGGKTMPIRQTAP